MSKKKTKIVIASVLKPVDDVRNYEKLGCSLAKDQQIEIVMLGTKNQSISTNPKILFLPWRSFERISIARIYVQFAFFKRLLSIRPSLVLITTHELIPMAIIAKLLIRFKLVYDVQEDYYKNLKYQRFYPRIIRYPAAFIIRSAEWISRIFVNHYLLAEKIYETELGFTKGKATVVDNKSLPISNLPSTETFNVIFTGTVTPYSKALECIELYSKNKHQFRNPRLVIIGHCPSVTYKKSLTELANNDSTITLILSGQPVSHLSIVKQISTANLAIIGYDVNPINEFKIPTKQYEYTAAKLPYIVRKNSYWSELGLIWGGAIPMDFDDVESSEIVEIIDKIDRNFIKSNEAHWTNNEDILNKALSSFIH